MRVKVIKVLKNIEILNSFNPELRFKEIESVLEIK